MNLFCDRTKIRLTLSLFLASTIAVFLAITPASYADNSSQNNSKSSNSSAEKSNSSKGDDVEITPVGSGSEKSSSEDESSSDESSNSDETGSEESSDNDGDNDDVPTPVVCISPQVLNVATNQCETPPTPVVCISPQVLNVVTNQCETPPTPVVCISPQVLNVSTNQCETPPTPVVCISPQVLNVVTNQCETPPTPVVCISPQVLNIATNQCETPPTPVVCISPQVLNVGTNQCETPPAPTTPPARTTPTVPEAPKSPALVEFEETIYVSSGITSNVKETTTGKFLKNSMNIKTYKTGESYVKVPSTGTIQSFVQPGSGSVVNASGELRYTQNPKFKGTTKFSYITTNAEGGLELHKVTVIVANKAPLLISAQSSDTKTEQEAWTTTAKSLAFSSLDPNGDKYKVTVGTPSKDVKVTYTAGKLNLSAPREFSGFVDVDVIATDADNAVTIVPARFVVNPGVPSASSVLTVSKEVHMRSGLNMMFEFTSVVNFKRSINATGVSLVVNGINQGYEDDHAATIILPEPAGVKDSIMLKMTGNDGTESAAVKVPVKVALGAPVARVNFDTDSWALTTGAKKILNELALTSAHLNVTAFDLFGHADGKRGKIPNQTLSDKRAASVKSYLLSVMKKAGISDVQLTKQGLSDKSPFSLSKSAAGLAINRRVEVFLPTL